MTSERNMSQWLDKADEAAWGIITTITSAAFKTKKEPQQRSKPMDFPVQVVQKSENEVYMRYLGDYGSLAEMGLDRSWKDSFGPYWIFAKRRFGLHDWDKLVAGERVLLWRKESTSYFDVQRQGNA